MVSRSDSSMSVLASSIFPPPFTPTLMPDKTGMVLLVETVFRTDCRFSSKRSLEQVIRM
jgi:hypothetical protein